MLPSLFWQLNCGYGGGCLCRYYTLKYGGDDTSGWELILKWFVENIVFTCNFSVSLWLFWNYKKLFLNFLKYVGGGKEWTGGKKKEFKVYMLHFFSTKYKV